MPTFERGTIVRVPFPYNDRNTRQRRPSLVVSNGPVGPAGALLWVVMITSAMHQAWPGDVAVAAGERSGLPVPSIIRSAKIATIEAKDADVVGRVDDETHAKVAYRVGHVLGLAQN